MTQLTDKTDATLTQSPILTDTPFVEVTKEFNAPIDQVWKAWSDADLIKQWWGPENYTSPSTTTDFRIDGKYLFAMESPEGKVLWSTGFYNEILPFKLIVCTDQICDHKGNPISPEEADMDEEWEDVGTLIFSVKFEELGNDRTRIQLVHEGIPASMHDECVEGWSTSLDKMKVLVEKH